MKLQVTYNKFDVSLYEKIRKSLTIITKCKIRIVTIDHEEGTVHVPVQGQRNNFTVKLSKC